MFVLLFVCTCLMLMGPAYGLGTQIHAATGHDSLLNKHLKVAAEPWKPFFVFYCPDGKEKTLNENCADEGDETYGGALWDFLKFIQRARNVTFSILRAPDKAWGVCYEKNNCTGMIGMVNRGEVDFAIGTYMH